MVNWKPFCTKVYMIDKYFEYFVSLEKELQSAIDQDFSLLHDWIFEVIYTVVLY